MGEDGTARMRVDKWLWQARFVKTRALAAEIASSGRLRVNGQRCAKPAQPVGPGDVLTFPQAGRVRVIRVLGIGARRGPATEAQALYDDLEPAPAAEAPAEAPATRPDRRDRRARRDIARLSRGDP